MPIQSLPPSTVRIIGSSQVLTDPASVVKELVDNALDARATAIFVEMSINALDVIQVRDNGHGVAPDDRDMVCRRNCTSKISDYADLKDVGGKWLGFRGEALSSAAELSGALTLTTKVEGEDVAVALRIRKNGEVEGRDRASHPVGTTVRIVELFKHIPVRRQTALKGAAKSLIKTKRMLQSYALARPSTRFSLKVLKAKNNKSDWTYAPKPKAAIEDAAYKVVGKDCAGQCEWAVSELNGFEVHAFLPRVDAVCSKISNVGSFVSIDSRPVSTMRGILKQMMTIFKEKLRACSPTLENAKAPFIWINIICPPESYDPNVEPAKDDVMFDDKSKVLEAVEAMMDQRYPAMTRETEAPAVSGSIEVFEDPIEDEAERPAKRQRTHTNMYAGLDEDSEMLDDPQLPDAADEEEEEDTRSGLQNVNVSNPWIMAKMHSSTRPRRTGSQRNGQLLTPLQERTSSDANSASATEPVGFPPHPPWNLLTPHTSSSPIRARTSSQPDLLSTDEALGIRRLVRESDLTSEGDTDPIHDEEEQQLLQTRQASRPTWKAANDFISARQLPLSTPTLNPEPRFTAPPSPQQQRQSPHKQQYLRRAAAAAAGIQKSFVPPVHDDSRVWFDHLPSSSSPRKRQTRPRRQNHQDVDIRAAFASASGTVSNSPRPQQFPRKGDRRLYHDDDDDDDDSAEDDEVRHPVSNTCAPDSVNPPLPTPVHRNRTHAFDSPHPSDATISSAKPSPQPHNNLPTRNPARLQRTATARLPLERVPHGAELQTLITHLSISVDRATAMARALVRGREEAAWGLPVEGRGGMAGFAGLGLGGEVLEGWVGWVERWVAGLAREDEGEDREVCGVEGEARDEGDRVYVREAIEGLTEEFA